MTFKSLLVNLAVDGSPEPLLHLAADLAGRFDARLVGFAAADVTPVFSSVEGAMIDGEAMQRERDYIEQRIGVLEKHFRSVAGRSLKAEWQGFIEPPSMLLPEAARSADLIVTGQPAGPGVSNPNHAVDLGALILNAGRPVLIAAADAERVLAKKAVIAWKDSREARRAVFDALPFLSMAEDVLVVTVDEAGDGHAGKGVEQVVSYLACHKIKARAQVIEGQCNGEGLVELAKSFGADLLVSGAYGHSRIREWVFGGVTRSLLGQGGINRLMSN